MSAPTSAHRIAAQAWSPIAQGAVLDHPVITAIAGTVGKSPARRSCAGTSSGNIVFELGPEDVARIDALDRGEAGRIGPNPDTFAMISGLSRRDASMNVSRPMGSRGRVIFMTKDRAKSSRAAN